MVYRDFDDLPRGTASDKVSRDKKSKGTVMQIEKALMNDRILKMWIQVFILLQ